MEPLAKGQDLQVNHPRNPMKLLLQPVMTQTCKLNMMCLISSRPMAKEAAEKAKAKAEQAAVDMF
jgi:hypothetical protein